MNSTTSSVNSSLKKLEYVKRQEQLRSLGNPKNTPKPLSADSMIEDLLSKKETFQKRASGSQPKQEVSGWLCGPVPQMYSQVWASVQSANGLADTPLLSTLLMSSGLSTDTLGYIWSLANHTVPGALTQQEVHLVLALVALTQSGYHTTNLATVLQLPQAPIPALDLSLLSTPQQQKPVYPSPLSVSGLQDSHTYSWVAPETQPPNGTDNIGVSYVSSGPMVSQQLLTGTANLSFTDFQTTNAWDIHSNTSTSTTLRSLSKNAHSKHSGNTLNFSFPSLNESPSHIAGSKSEGSDPFDDEFTDFQSADFTTVNSITSEVHNNLVKDVVDDDDEEFSNFQKATPKSNDDLSVLVIDGKNIPSAQTLWVAEDLDPTIIYNIEGMELKNTGRIQDAKETKHPPSVTHTIGDKLGQSKYDVFKEMDDGRFSVFHNPLPDHEDNHNDLGVDQIESSQLETKSISNHSLFSEQEQCLDFFKPDHQSVNSMDDFKSNPKSQIDIDIPKQIYVAHNNNNDGDDEEFSTFQNFPVTFPDPNSQSHMEEGDKYDIFRTIVFENNLEPLSQMPKAEEAKNENYTQVSLFETGMDGNLQNDSKEHEAISDKTCSSETKMDPSTEIKKVEDKYKALRLIEESSNEMDDFGEFLGADVPNDENQLPISEKPSVQVRCLEACLNLLKDGLATLSRASSQEVVSEVIRDPRASTYFDCLLEVHRVSERIISNMEGSVCGATKAELCQIWEQLRPYFAHTEHNHLPETVGVQCGVCHSNTGPAPVTFGAMTFHSPCANLYLHCVEPVLP
ncbi:synergin gamma-like isoform X2 [Macrosteles quadrilineatus]|uniref:synergin gamma-like isoform X2 n=1 Tax=Macrosteles quadrilineatus TaxID=74068 RepID=UPI0023E24E42|nr:synergin gamma-like isoform X2 [Macrosteles quadrilineatus]